MIENLLVDVVHPEVHTRVGCGRNLGCTEGRDKATGKACGH